MSNTVFIAIPFNDAFDVVYSNAILPAILKCDLQPYRVDELKRGTSIIHDIESGILNSTLVIADLTSRNSNVFFEVGFARASAKNVISVTQNRNDVPFDLKDRRYLFYTKTSLGLLKFENDLIQWINEILKQQKTSILSKVFIHGTKFEVPNKNEFWNDLCRTAKKKFYLLGGSNKSWINKSEEQSEELATAIIRLTLGHGTVKIISDNLPNTIQKHIDFYNQFLKSKLKSKALLSKFRKSFLYGVVTSSNYKAVISDDRIILLPTMNSEQFRDEALVMELEGSHLPYFKNYLADIERLFKEKKCQIIDLTF